MMPIHTSRGFLKQEYIAYPKYAVASIDMRLPSFLASLGGSSLTNLQHFLNFS